MNFRCESRKNRAEKIENFLFQVLKRHVEEAFQLLNKSIIRVEQPDITMEEKENDNPVTSVREGKLLLCSGIRQRCIYLKFHFY